MAADLLEANAADLELADGFVRVKGSPDRCVTIASLASTANGDQQLIAKGTGAPPPTPAPGDTSSCVGRLGMESFAAPTFGTHAVRVKIDRETGVVRVLEVAAVQDSGTIVNQIGAAGQVTGGVMMGIGQALSEVIQIGDDGRVRNPYLLDYKLQTMADTPEMKIGFIGVAAPDAGPKGSKGLGEPPCIPTPGAIANAIANGTGARIRQLPASPHRVWAAIQGLEA